MTTSYPKRRFFSYSLRTLMLVGSRHSLRAGTQVHTTAIVTDLIKIKLGGVWT